MIFNQSGGTSLNFKVVKNPQPVNPSQNTIWLDTDHKINGYSFSATQPENMAEGEVWFGIGADSDVAFSATKKNPVMVYPLSSKQKINGTLVDVTAKSYQNGEWVDWWRGELYKDGKLYNVLEDGFETFGNTVVEYKDGYFIYYSGIGEGTLVSPKKVDTKGYKTVKIVGGLSFTTGAIGAYKMGLATAKNTNSLVSSVQFANGNTVKEYTINIPSDGGEYYLVLTCGGSTGKTNYVKITEIIME